MGEAVGLAVNDASCRRLFVGTCPVLNIKSCQGWQERPTDDHL